MVWDITFAMRLRRISSLASSGRAPRSLRLRAARCRSNGLFRDSKYDDCLDRVVWFVGMRTIGPSSPFILPTELRTRGLRVLAYWKMATWCQKTYLTGWVRQLPCDLLELNIVLLKIAPLLATVAPSKSASTSHWVSLPEKGSPNTLIVPLLSRLWWERYHS